MRRAAAAALLALSAVLLLARLGHYALWDDEAGTALTALGVLETGDTSALVGRNLFAYGGGAELEGTRLRYMPPLQAWLAAPSLALLGRDSALAARLPFALCALGAVGLMLLWLFRARADGVDQYVFSAALLANASFFLYGRQARYYAPALLCTLAVAYLYVFWDGSRRRLAWLAAWSTALLALNYLSFAALWLCLAADDAAFGRRARSLDRKDWALLLLPQLAAAAVLLSVWSPFGKDVMERVSGAWLSDVATSVWYALRDLQRCEMLFVPLLAAAPLLYRRARDPWLLRAPLAVAVYILAVACLAPLPASGPRVAQVRYFVPLIPLGLALAVLCARALPRRRRLSLALPILVLAAQAMTMRDFVRELIAPPGDPYRAAADWVNAHVPEGGTVWVAPEHMTYPLMFHAPRAVYAWQLDSPPRPDLAGLPDIHYRGRVPPDYVVAFGPAAAPVERMLAAAPAGVGRYERLTTLDRYWQDLHRPELFWRRGAPVTDFDRETQAIHVYKRRM